MKHSRSKALLLAVPAAAALALAGCGQAPTKGGETPESEQSGDAVNASDVKVCMVAGLGGLDDKSFNESGYEGLKRAEKDMGVKVKVSETFSDADYVPHIENMVNEGCALVIGVSYMMTEAITDAAKQYPNVKFALFDDVIPEDLPNAKGIVFNTAEATYLAGYLASGMSETGRVGTFMGGKIAPTMLFADGFADGVQRYNQDNDADVKLIGWDKAKQDGMATGDFEDIQKGKHFSEQLIQQGADVIMPVAGVVSSGALAAAREAGNTSVIWVDVDGYYSEKDYRDLILTSVLKQIGNALYTTVEELVAGEFSSEDYIGTLENEGVGLAPYHDFEDKVPDELNAQIDSLRQEIIAGTTVVESPSAPH